MLRASDKRLLKNEIASIMEDVALAMLLGSGSEFEEDSEEDSAYDLLSTLALAHDDIRLTIS